MAEIDKKIKQLIKKKSAKTARLEKMSARISEVKSDIKSLSKEIAEIESEIRQLELEQLSETLSQNGITAADVAAAIAAGEIKKSEKTDDEREKIADTYSTNSEDEEVTENEISDSRETVRGA